MSEPDRFDKLAEELDLSGNQRARVAAALRREHDAALDEAAREAEALSSNYDKERAELADSIADAIRALASHAVAPAAEPRDVVTGTARETYAGIDFMRGATPPKPAAPAPPFVSDLVIDALQRCERARTANAHPPMLCVACAGEAARAARFPARAAPHAKGEGT